MYLLAGGLSTAENIMQLLSIIIVFVLILIAAYFTTRFVGKSSITQPKTKNIKVIETYRLAPNRFIQIIKVGEKYIVIGVGKDNIEMLIELKEEQLNLDEIGTSVIGFKEMLEKIKQKSVVTKENKNNK